MMMNEDFENKWEVKTLLIKLEIKKITVSMYYSQMNDMIKCEHTSIMQALLKSYENQLYWWKHYMLMIIWTDKIIIYELINKYEFILFFS